MDELETHAMAAMLSILEGLTPLGRKRVLSWLVEMFDVVSPNPLRERRGGAPDRPGTVHDLLEAAQITSKTERALVVAHWMQACRDGEGWGGGELNDVLRGLGHGLSNVTRTMSALGTRRPPLVMQVGTMGRSRRARKTYKVTAAGSRHVRRLLGEAEAAA